MKIYFCNHCDPQHPCFLVIDMEAADPNICPYDCGYIDCPWKELNLNDI